MGSLYQIDDGVRRAKAAELLGHGYIWAVIDEMPPEQQVKVSDLLSPNSYIDVSQPRKLVRWLNVWNGMNDEPDLLPPIFVRRGSKGLPLAQVKLVGLPP